MPLRNRIPKAITKATAPPPAAARARPSTTRVAVGARPSPATGNTAATEAPTTKGPQGPLASIIRARRIVFGTAVFAIAIFGSIYGAGLKIREDAEAIKEEWETSSPEMQVMQLQAVRKKYERMAEELKAKLEVVEGRITDKSKEDDGNVAASSPSS